MKGGGKMDKQTKKAWETPILDILDINLTMAGPGTLKPDAIQSDPDEIVNFTPTGS